MQRRLAIWLISLSLAASAPALAGLEEVPTAGAHGVVASAPGVVVVDLFSRW